MMNYIQHSSKLIVLSFILMIGVFGCKSKKLAMEAAANKEKARIEQEAALKKQKEREAEEAKKREAEELERRRLKEAEMKAATPKAKLTEYFQAIAGAGNVASANNSINEALSLFASPETPVLIVISEYGNNQKDYDRPTTIKDYLNYLKDQKKNANAISDLKFDGAGKITEIELKKPL